MTAHKSCDALIKTIVFILLSVPPFFSHTFSQTSTTAAPSQQVAITIAVASNFYYPLTQIIEASEYWQRQNVRLVSGSSGVLYAQIVNGAPYDLFLSADAARPQSLFENGLSQAPISYAQGNLVLWPVDKNTTVEQSLLRGKGRIAIANPKTAPFGSAALAYLQNLPQFSAFENQLVFGNNIAQTFQFVDTGNASVGFIAESMLKQAQAKFPLKRERYAAYVQIDSDTYPPILQQGAVTAKTETDEYGAAKAFLHHLLSSKVQTQLHQLGYRKVHQ
jgi:molybdenum ABC transporter molybdate-binding protein